jgi:hypothetical protein
MVELLNSRFTAYGGEHNFTASAGIYEPKKKNLVFPR